jgi:site-specific recombinase XerD
MKHLSGSELKKLMVHVPSKWKLLVLVSFWHGLRASEATQLTGNSIRDGYVQVPRLKGSKETNQPYVFHADPELSEGEGLLELAKTVKGSERLFPIGRQHFWTIMQNSCKQAGIPHIFAHPHVLKHSLAMALHEKGKPVEEIQKILGHARITSTMVYVQVSEQQALKGVGACI